MTYYPLSKALKLSQKDMEDLAKVQRELSSIQHRMFKENYESFYHYLFRGGLRPKERIDPSNQVWPRNEIIGGK
mgnify:CR=1 FL=1